MVGVGLYCENFFMRSDFFEHKTELFILPFLSKAGPFTLERHIWFESIKMQGFPKQKQMPY